jgi:hypothetical protein
MFFVTIMEHREPIWESPQHRVELYDAQVQIWQTDLGQLHNEPRGKPELLFPISNSYFNMSHCNVLALCAFARSRPGGTDVEAL